MAPPFAPRPNESHTDDKSYLPVLEDYCIPKQSCLLKAVSKCFHRGKCVTAPFRDIWLWLNVSIKRRWSASGLQKSNRMKACVQLGLLCLSLLISSLHGKETDTETSKELLGKFDEQDIQVRGEFSWQSFNWAQSYWEQKGIYGYFSFCFFAKWLRAIMF